MDDTCRCCNCRYYDDFESLCKLNPPVYAGDISDEYGERFAHWSQPVIGLEWAEWCGQWKAADENQTEAQRAEQIMTLLSQHKDATSTRERHDIPQRGRG